MAVMVNPGDFRSCRNANFRSPYIGTPPESGSLVRIRAIPCPILEGL
jgi:hypothetical protein